MRPPGPYPNCVSAGSRPTGGTTAGSTTVPRRSFAVIAAANAIRSVFSRCITKPSTVTCHRQPTFQLSHMPAVRYGEPPQPHDQSVGCPPPYGLTPFSFPPTQPPSLTTGGNSSSVGNLPSSSG